MRQGSPSVSAATGIPLNRVQDTLDTFDLILWAGEGNLSRFIQAGTNSTWSHVGMVVRLPGLPLLLWESTIDDDFSGVRMTPLAAQVYGHVAVRRLTGVTRTPEQFGQLMAARQELEGRPFEQSWLEFVRAGYDGPWGQNTRDLTSLFCAELVAETLQRVGLLDGAQASNEFTPRDFSSEASAPLPLLQGATLEPELLLAPPDAGTLRARTVRACMQPPPSVMNLFSAARPPLVPRTFFRKESVMAGPSGIISDLPLDSVRYLYGLLRGQETFNYDRATDSALNLLTYLRNQFRSVFGAKSFTTATLAKFNKTKAIKSLAAMIDHAEGRAVLALAVPPELWGFLLNLLAKWALGKK